MVRRILYLFLFSFLVFGSWEWLQTPFYRDVSEEINAIVWFRFHCTLVDILILAGCVAIVAVLRRGLRWLERPRVADLALVSALGTAYTAVSEYLNVHLRGAWGYSAWMPVLPLVEIGLVPLVQWLLLPSCVLLLLRDHQGGLEAPG